MATMHHRLRFFQVLVVILSLSTWELVSCIEHNTPDVQPKHRLKEKSMAMEEVWENDRKNYFYNDSLGILVSIKIEAAHTIIRRITLPTDAQLVDARDYIQYCRFYPANNTRVFMPGSDKSCTSCFYEYDIADIESPLLFKDTVSGEIFNLQKITDDKYYTLFDKMVERMYFAVRHQSYLDSFPYQHGSHTIRLHIDSIHNDGLRKSLLLERVKLDEEVYYYPRYDYELIIAPNGDILELYLPQTSENLSGEDNLHIVRQLGMMVKKMKFKPAVFQGKPVNTKLALSIVLKQMEGLPGGYRE